MPNLPSAYPGAIDDIPNPDAATDDLDTPGVEHDAQHTRANNGIEAIQTTLGTNPHGIHGNVRDRLQDIETAQMMGL